MDLMAPGVTGRTMKGLDARITRFPAGRRAADGGQVTGDPPPRVVATPPRVPRFRPAIPYGATCGSIDRHYCLGHLRCGWGIETSPHRGVVWLVSPFAFWGLGSVLRTTGPEFYIPVVVRRAGAPSPLVVTMATTSSSALSRGPWTSTMPGVSRIPRADESPPSRGRNREHESAGARYGDGRLAAADSWQRAQQCEQLLLRGRQGIVGEPLLGMAVHGQDLRGQGFASGHSVGSGGCQHCPGAAKGV